MNNKVVLPNSFVVGSEALEYEEQGPSHCGAYSVKAVLNSLGRYKKRHPKYLHTNFFCKITGVTLGKNYYVGILRKHGIDSSFRNASMGYEDKIGLLKKLLVTNN